MRSGIALWREETEKNAELLRAFGRNTSIVGQYSIALCMRREAIRGSMALCKCCRREENTALRGNIALFWAPLPACIFLKNVSQQKIKAIQLSQL
jgi:hypothetical protein